MLAVLSITETHTAFCQVLITIISSIQNAAQYRVIYSLIQYPKQNINISFCSLFNHIQTSLLQHYMVDCIDYSIS